MKSRIIIAVLAIFALNFASCQKSESDIQAQKQSMQKINVRFNGDFSNSETKTEYTYDESAHKLHPSWEEGDVVVAFDGSGNKYKMTVSNVNSSGLAEFDCEGSAPIEDGTTLYLVYEKNTTNTTGCISDNTVAVNYGFQEVKDNGMAAVMVAAGEVQNQMATFHFTNAASVFAIFATHGVPSGHTINRVALVGENLSNAVISISGEHLVLTPASKEIDNAGTVKSDCIATVIDENGTLSNPVYLAVPAGAKINTICLSVGNDTYTYKYSTVKTVGLNELLAIRTAVFTKEDYAYEIIDGHMWAKENLAITDSGKKIWKGNRTDGTDTGHIIGDYFQWATFSGYLSVTESDPYGLLLYDAFSCKYCADDTVNSISYKNSSKTFKNTCPYKTGDESYSKYKTKGNILEIVDDAASIVMGDGWHIPSRSEYTSLLEAVDFKYDATDAGFYLVPKGAELELDKSNAILFFPLSGYFNNDSAYKNIAVTGYYWTNERYTGNYAYRLALYNNAQAYIYSENNRTNGQNIRPVK